MAGNMACEVVIHVEFGGFHLDTEMAHWLRGNCGWCLVPETEVDVDSWPLESLQKSLGDRYYSPRFGDIEFRSHKDIVACVKALKVLHADEKRVFGKPRRMVHNLKVVPVVVTLSVEDVYDGKERVNVDWTDC